MTNTALNAYISKIGEIQAQLAELQSKADNHFDNDPEAVNWGHVGDLNSVLSLIKQANNPES